jgi:hypothetical protein
MGERAGVETFVDDDDAFLDWRDSHPDGYIVNADRRPQAEYLVLHRATCPTMRLPNASLQWTRSYIKICANNSNELTRWASQTVTGFHGLNPCGICKP